MAKNKLDSSIQQAVETMEKLRSGFIDIDKAILSAAKSAKSLADIPVNATPKDVNDRLQKSATYRKQVNEQLKEQQRLEKALASAQAKFYSAQSGVNKELQRTRVETSILNKKQKEQAELSSKLVGEYRKQSIILNKLRAEYKNMALLYGENSKQAKSLLAQVTRLDSKLKRVDANAGQFQRSVGNYGKAFRGLGNTVRSVASAFGLMSGAFIAVQVIKNGISRIREFDKEMQNMAGITRTSRKELKDVEEQIIEVAASSTKTSNEVAKLATSLFVLGKTKDEVKLLLKPVNDLSIALGATSDETGEFLVQTLNSFGKGAESAAQFADIIATIRTSTSLDFQKMRDSFQYLSPISRLLGEDLAYTGAVIGILADNGLKAEQAGRLLATAQQKLATQGLTLADALEQVNKAQKEGKSNLEVLALASDLFGKQAGKVGAILSNNTDIIQKNAQAIRDNGGALDDLINEQLESLDAKIKILDSSYEKFILTLDNGEGKITKLFHKAIAFGEDFFTTLTNINSSGRDFYEWGKNAAKIELGKELKKDVDGLNISVEEAAKRKLPELTESLEKYKGKLNELTQAQRDSWIDGGLLGEAVTSQNIKHTQKAIGKYEEMIALAREAAGLLAERPGFIGPTLDQNNEEPFSMFGGGEESSSDSGGIDKAIDGRREYQEVIDDIKDARDRLSTSTAEEADAINDEIELLEKEKEAWERSNKKLKERKDIDIASTIESGSVMIKKNISYWEELIQVAENTQDSISDPVAWNKLQDQIKEFKQAIEDIKGNGNVFDGIELDLTGSMETDLIFKGMDKLSNLLGQNMEDLVMEFSSEYEWDYNEFVKWSQKKVEQADEENKLKKEKLADWMQFAGDAVYEVGSLAMAFSERKIQKYEDEIQKNNEMYENWLENENLTEAERKQLEKEKAQREEELNKKKAKEQEKQAKIDKATSAFQIAINTAAAIVRAFADLGPVAGIPASISIGALGAIQLATVLAKPIPKYKYGRKGGKAELAEVGDGGKSEVVTDNRGRFKYITPNKPSYTFLEKGDNVISSVPEYLEGMTLEKLNKASILTSLQSQAKALNDRQTEQNIVKNIEDAIYKGYSKVKVPEQAMPDYDRLARQIASELRFTKRRDV